MSAIAPIVIADGQATPVNHTFNPVVSAPEAFYRESIANLPLVGQGTVTLKMKADGALTRVTCVLALPALEVVTGQNSSGYSAGPKVAYSNTIKAEFILPTRGTAQQRKDLRVLLKNLLDNAQIIDVIENLNTPY